MTDDEATDLSNYKRLYCAVILQAVIDATSEPKTIQQQIDRDRARAWFFASAGTTAQAYEEICLLADVEPERLRTFLTNYEGPPLSQHALSRLRDSINKGGSNE